MSIILILLGLTTNYGSVSGFVIDASNGERLSFANVYLKDTKLGSSTNEKGYYIIHQIPVGKYQLVFSYIGYEDVYKEIEIAEGRNLIVNVEMKPAIIEIGGINVLAERARFEKGVEVSHITFTPREIKSVPRIFESDLIKILQLMPGVVAMHDLSNKLYVRGGSPDENLVLLDGITVYNPSTHLFGLFSTFNPDAVGDAELYAGGFPVGYGDRLSSVLDITTKEGNFKKYTGETSIGLITSKLLFEGPIPNGSFLLSGRRTYFDALIWAYSQIKKDSVSLPYYFYDGIAKINFNPSSENRFTFAGMSGSDVIRFEESWDSKPEERVDLEWGNRGTSLRWRRVFGPKFYGEILGAWSNFFTHLGYKNYTDTTANLHFYEEIIDWTLKCDFDYFLNEKHTLNYGIDGKHLNIEYHLEQTEHELFSNKYDINLFNFYLQDKWVVIPPILYLQYGLRGMYYDLGHRFRIDPRLGMKYRFQPNTAFNFSMGKYSQFLVTINSQESYFSIFDFWRPVDKIHSIPTAYHAIGGIEQWLGEKTRFTIEGYYKKYYNLLIPKEYDIAFSSPSESLRVGNGYSAGIDLYIKKSFEEAFGWISYSLGFTKRKLGLAYYSPRYDRRHNLNIVFGFTVPRSIPIFKNIRLNLRWYFATGLPYAGDLGRYRYFAHYEEEEQIFTYWLTIKGPRDAYRLPASHRLDFHLEKDIRFFGLNGSWYFDIINLYNRKNIVFYEWDYYDDWGNELDPPRKVGYSLLPIPIPCFGVKLKF